jgi:phosphoribosylamine-glycine ligase
MKLRDEGNEVRFAISESADLEYHLVGNGMIEKTTLAKSADWADVVVFDSNIFELPEEAEELRKFTKVLGSSKLSGELENDRAFAVQIAKSVGLNVPDYKEFVGTGAWKSAKTYLESAELGESSVVWKPNGEAPVSTFVAGDIDQMIHMLDYWEALYREHKEEPNFIITSKIDGPEISTEGWFNGEEFFVPNHTLERTRFFDGDHGEKTGCAGNVVWHLDGELFRHLINPFKNVLEGKYSGPFDVNAIIDEKTNKPIFLEFTPRFGYDAIFGMIQSLKGDLGELFYQIASGEIVTVNVRSDFAGATRLHIPPYPEPPNEDDKLRPVGLPVKGWNVDSAIVPIFPVEVMIKDDRLVTSGPDGYVIVVGGNGSSPKQAMEASYKNVEKLEIPLMRYRLDLAKKLEEVYNTILTTGWIGRPTAFRKAS